MLEMFRGIGCAMCHAEQGCVFPSIKAIAKAE